MRYIKSLLLAGTLVAGSTYAHAYADNRDGDKWDGNERWNQEERWDGHDDGNWEDYGGWNDDWGREWEKQKDGMYGWHGNSYDKDDYADHDKADYGNKHDRYDSGNTSNYWGTGGGYGGGSSYMIPPYTYTQTGNYPPTTGGATYPLPWVAQWEATFDHPLFEQDSIWQFEKKNQFRVTVEDAKVRVSVLDKDSGLAFATAKLNGSQEVPAVNTPAVGSSFFIIDTKNNKLKYFLSYTGLSGGNEISAHIHGPAMPGQNAWVLTPLTLGELKVGTWTYDESLESSILEGKTYVNVHSQSFPNGEIRGQIIPINLTQAQ